VLERKNKQATTALHASEERYRSIVENALEGIFRSTPTEGFIDVNPTLVQMLGYDSKEEVLALNLEKDLYADPQDQQYMLDQHRSKEAVRNLEVTWKKENGEHIIVSLNSQAIYDAQGQFLFYEGLVQDVTERKRTEDALRDYVERLETLRGIDRAIIRAQSPREIAQAALRCIRRLVPCIGACLVTLDFEAKQATLLAIDADGESGIREKDRYLSLEALGDSARVVEELRQGELCVLANDLDHSQLPQRIQALWTKEMHAVLGVPLTFQETLIGFLALGVERTDALNDTHVEITQEVADQLAVAIQNARLLEAERRRGAELEAALARQEELDSLKNEFIQNVSHELRSPLALIRGYAEILADGELGELQQEQQKPIKTIVRRSRMLSDLVEDITLILGAETRPLEQMPLSPDEVARTAVEDFRVAVDQAGLKLQAEIVPGLPPVSGSLTYLRRVMDNLLSNAIKFTSEGGTITVRAWQEGKQVALEVQDSGIGIPAEQLERIFERFYQVDGSARRRYGGVGLGLALVKEIVSLHGGQVTVTSQVDEGSTFTITLPICEG
jgi:PAS domain S-box-containing protein